MHQKPKTQAHIEGAEQILRLYEQVARRPELDFEAESVLADLLADLHHWSDSKGLDWDSAIDLAKQFHQEEVPCNEGSPS